MSKSLRIESLADSLNHLHEQRREAIRDRKQEVRVERLLQALGDSMEALLKNEIAKLSEDS